MAKMAKGSPPTEDDYIRAVLDFIDRDIAANPHRLVPFSEELLREVDELVEGVQVDLDAPLPDDDHDSFERKYDG